MFHCNTWNCNEKASNLAHNSIRAARKLVRERYVWPGLSKQYQREKGIRQSSALLSTYSTTDKRFHHAYIDLIGLLGRFSRWPTAIPIPDISAYTVTGVFITGWRAVEDTWYISLANHSIPPAGEWNGWKMAPNA